MSNWYRLMKKGTTFTVFSCMIILFILFHPEQVKASKNLHFHSFFDEDESAFLAAMSIEEKVGQVLIFGFRGYTIDEDHAEWLSSGRLGNIKIFLRNVQSKEQLQKLTNVIEFLTANSDLGIPPFIATDLEGGIVNNIRNSEILLVPVAGLVGATGNASNSAHVSELIALTLRDLGVNMNFAPCADVLTNPENRVIGTRAYSSDPAVVYAMVKAFIEEQEKAGIVTTVKHFPGHGMTDFDSHLYSKSVDTSFTELCKVHLFPYLLLIEENEMDGCMVSHVIYNNIDPFYPAAFSQVTISGVLRDKLKFKGIVITDDLEMEGSQSYASDIVKAFILAFRAGNDLILVSHTKEKQEKLINETAALFRSGTLNERELDTKVLRILQVKKSYLKRFYFWQERDMIQQELLKDVEESVKKASDDGIVLISSNIDVSLPVYFKRASQKGPGGLILSPTGKFTELAKEYLPGWDVINVGYFPNKRKNMRRLLLIRKRFKDYDRIILGLANERQVPWAEACINGKVPFGILSIGNPLIAAQFAQSALFIVTSFEPYSPAIDSMFNCVFLTGEFHGSLPYHFSSQK